MPTTPAALHTIAQHPIDVANSAVPVLVTMRRRCRFSLFYPSLRNYPSLRILTAVP